MSKLQAKLKPGWRDQIYLFFNVGCAVQRDLGQVLIRQAISMVVVVVLAQAAYGQDAIDPDAFFSPQAEMSVEDFNWTYIPVPDPPEIKVHDIITIIVDEKAELSANARFNRNRTATLKAELNEFMRINENGNLGNAASNQPAIDGTLNGRLQSNAQLTEQEGIRYRIAAMIVGIRPNGNLVVEARKTLRSNSDVWEYSLTGEIMASAVRRDGTALSEDIYNLKITNNKQGKLSNTTRLPWGTRLYDIFFPF